MSKNIVIFSDGTGQEGGKGPDTNVYKLFKAVKNRTPSQIVFYDRGLGTGRLRITGKMSGAGMSENIKDCYKFIFSNFESKDNIYLFGFSRGAATVRSLSGFIHTFGILPKSRPELIDEAYKIYKLTDREKRETAVKDFHQKHHPMWTKIKFLGVWDTVPALGAPIPIVSSIINYVPGLKHKFHDFSLSKSVENAYHALSIDDERESFHPDLWGVEIQPGQTMEQVWFCGAHTDVGGGYAESDLSQIAFRWMTEKAIKHDLILHDEKVLQFKENPDGYLHDSRGGKLSRHFRRKEGDWPKTDGHGKPRGKPDVHPSVLKRTLGRDNIEGQKYKPWIFKHLD